MNESGSGYNTARQEAESPTQFSRWGPDVGVGLRVPIGSRFAARAECEDLVLTHPQADMVVSLGLSLVLSGTNGQPTHVQR